MRHEMVTILNREVAEDGEFGVDSDGISWRNDGQVHAAVDWNRGMRAMNNGSLDVYGVVMIRMNWNNIITARSRVVHNGLTYQILGDTFHADRQGNTIQFQAQQVIEE